MCVEGIYGVSMFQGKERERVVVVSTQVFVQEKAVSLQGDMRKMVRKQQAFPSEVVKDKVNPEDV